MNEQTTRTRVVVAGATGWAGSALSTGIADASDLDLVGALSRSHAGERLGDVLGIGELDVEVSGTIAEALASSPDVFVEYTHPTVAKANVLAALEAGAHVVVGTSGLGSDDYAAIHRAAEAKGLGVLACGNFSITAVLMMRFSEMAARWVTSWEVIDYASAGKVDAPSGTALELADRLASAGPPEVAVPIGQTQGEREARGAELEGTQVHSVRLPSFVDLARVHLRRGGRTPHHPPRRRQQRGSLRGGRPPRDQEGAHAGRGPPRTRHRDGPGALVVVVGVVFSARVLATRTRAGSTRVRGAVRSSGSLIARVLAGPVGCPIVAGSAGARRGRWSIRAILARGVRRRGG